MTTSELSSGGARPLHVLTITPFYPKIGNESGGCFVAEPLAEFLATLFGQSGLVLHGGTSVKKRQEFVDQFQREDGPPFFVLSLKAGGTGLNLTAMSSLPSSSLI